MAEKSLTIAIKGRDESAAAFKSAEKRIVGLTAGSVLAAAGAIFAVSTLAAATATGIQVAMAANSKAVALQKGLVTDMLESQLDINNAWSNMAATIPVIGIAVQQIVDILSDSEGIRKQIARIKELDKSIEQLVITSRNWRRQNELAAAEAFGDADALAKVRSRHLAEDREKTLAQARLVASTAQKELAAAEQKLKKVIEIKDIRSTLGALGGPPGLIQLFLPEEATKASLGKVVEKAKEAKRKAQAELADQEKAEQERVRIAAADHAKKLGDLLDADAKKRADADEAAAKTRLDNEKIVAAELVALVSTAEERELTASRDKFARLRAMASENAQLLKETRMAEEREGNRIIEKFRDQREAAAQAERDREKKARETAAKAAARALASRVSDITGRIQSIIASQGGPKEVTAFQSRFLSRAPGRQDPAWVKRMNTQGKSNTKSIVTAINGLPVKNAQAIKEAFPLTSWAR